ncbi:MAG TPA: hypothetical protein VH682_17760 [Gemmataceae bacterium]|jgi:hypothetical protein
MADTLIEYVHLPRIDRGEVQLLWHCDFWDGPISGLCLYQGRKCWFQVCAEGEEEEGDPFYRRFLLLELSPEQLADEERWHELFRQKVGTHTDHGEARGELKRKEMWQEFYDEYAKRPKVDYTVNQPVGWFEN